MCNLWTKCQANSLCLFYICNVGSLGRDPIRTRTNFSESPTGKNEIYVTKEKYPVF